MIDIQTEQLFDLKHTLASDLLSSHRYPWEILPLLKDFLSNLIATLPEGEYDAPSPLVRVATDAHVAENVMLIGPCVIGHNTELRTGAYVRGSVLVGDGCVVGNSCELKNTILFDGAQVPHFNYVGDSILGYRAHMGAGAITSNVKGDRTTVTIATDREKINTNLKKCGAMLGDFAEIGCNCVLNPGTVIGQRAQIYPLSSVRGVIPKNHIFKSADCIVPKQ